MIFHKGKVFVYGGICNKGLDDDQIYQYTIENRQWKIIKLSGQSPGRRFFHSMDIFTENSLLIFAGKKKKGETTDYEASNDIYLVNLEELKCEALSITTTTPIFGHGCCINTTYSPVLYYVLGGSDDSGLACFDIHFLSEKG